MFAKKLDILSGIRQRVRSLWYARLRRIDLQVLWPCCLSRAEDIDTARGVFAVHAFSDRAWLFLGKAEIYRIISELTGECGKGKG